MGTAERYHSLDFLRATMMFLGIMLHGMLPFMTIPVPFWPAHDIDRSPAADLFVFVVHDFRMQTFFFLAGFFGCLLYQRYGLAGMIRHRFMRIVLPFGLALIIIEPTLQAVWFYGNASALRAVGLSFAPGDSVTQRVIDHFASGRFLEYIYPFHLWFLYFLIVFFVVMIPLVGIGNRLIDSRLDRFVGNKLTGKGGVLILAALTTPLLWPMKVWGMADTAEGWLPRACIFTYSGSRNQKKDGHGVSPLDDDDSNRHRPSERTPCQPLQPIVPFAPSTKTPWRAFCPVSIA